ncbi:MAG: efflux RND transporter periplasmic adaptor subunit [Planctomycetota bacterium]
MKTSGARAFTLTLVAVAGVALAWAIVQRLEEERSVGGPRAGDSAPIPVEVAMVQRDTLELRRDFSGTLDASEEFVVAARVGGRVNRLLVDLADPIRNGQVVAELDGEEFRQAVAQAEANLAVATAGRVQAASALVVADRATTRIRELGERGLASQAERDSAEAELLARQAGVEVAAAEITRAEAMLEAARIRLRYTTVTAVWNGDEGERAVAERHVDVGDTVTANAPLLTVVDLDPLTGVISVTERDYALLAVAQNATITTDAFPGVGFAARVQRIAPVFRESSRQARVELAVANSDHRLRPGMYVRASVVLDRAVDAWVIPSEALTTFGGRSGVFVVQASGTTVSFRPVHVGIESLGRTQILEDGLEGMRVVTLGHQLLQDGSSILIAGDPLPHTLTPDRARATTP